MLNTNFINPLRLYFSETQVDINRCEDDKEVIEHNIDNVLFLYSVLWFCFAWKAFIMRHVIFHLQFNKITIKFPLYRKLNMNLRMTLNEIASTQNKRLMKDCSCQFTLPNKHSLQAFRNWAIMKLLVHVKIYLKDN